MNFQKSRKEAECEGWWGKLSFYGMVSLFDMHFKNETDDFLLHTGAGEKTYRRMFKIPTNFLKSFFRWWMHIEVWRLAEVATGFAQLLCVSCFFLDDKKIVLMKWKLNANKYFSALRYWSKAMQLFLRSRNWRTLSWRKKASIL